MVQIHAREKEQFIKLFKEGNIDRIDDRFKILEAFLNTENHVTVEELHDLLQKNGEAFPLDFIHETMNMIHDFGFAHCQTFDNGHVRFEHRHLGQHHDHMICLKCRKILEFKNEKMETIQRNITAVHGFHMLQHKMEIYGICSDCLGQRNRLVTLDMARPGESVYIHGFDGGTYGRMRLLSMGLRVGDRIEVITNHNHGQMIVASEFKRFSLGRGLAQKIIVENKNKFSSQVSNLRSLLNKLWRKKSDGETD